MRAAIGFTCLLALAMGPDAAAADLEVRLRDRNGPVADAVVGLVPLDGTVAPAPMRLPRTASVDQQDLAFVPYVQVARPGGSAVFSNSDHTRHHVYSFSRAATFEMVLGPGERSGLVPLDAPGVIAVGCNIHDQMIAWLYVSDAPWLARSGAGGTVRLRGIPPGRYRLQVWHPRLDVRGNTIERRIRVGDGAPAAVDVGLRLRADARTTSDAERATY